MSKPDVLSIMENADGPFGQENNQARASRVEISECWPNGRTEEPRSFAPLVGKLPDDQISQNTQAALIVNEIDNQENPWQEKAVHPLLPAEAVCQTDNGSVEYAFPTEQRSPAALPALKKTISREEDIVEQAGQDAKLITVTEEHAHATQGLHTVPSMTNEFHKPKKGDGVPRPPSWSNVSQQGRSVEFRRKDSGTEEPTNQRFCGLFQCSFCNFVFQDLSELLQHQETHNQEKFQGIGNEVVHPESQQQPVLEWRRYRCIVCDKTFCKQSSLVTHLRIHTGEKPFSCHVCRRKFNQRTSLTVHLRTHTGEAPFPCPKCNRSFRQQSNLTHHLKSHQRGDDVEGADWSEENTAPSMPFMYLISESEDANNEVWENKVPFIKDDKEEETSSCKRPYVCGHCFKRFTHQSNLMVHQRIHTGDRSYRCQECGKHFTRRTSLMVHLRGHTGEMPYSCVQCGKSFRQQSNLLYHMKSHAILVEPKVDPSIEIEQNGKLSGQLIGPSGQYVERENPPLINISGGRVEENQVRAYQCTQCSKWFPSSHSLLLHQKFHAEQSNAIMHCREIQVPYPINRSLPHTYTENMVSPRQEHDGYPTQPFKLLPRTEGNSVPGMLNSQESTSIPQPGHSSGFQKAATQSSVTGPAKGPYHVLGRGRPRKVTLLGQGQSQMGAFLGGKAIHKCWKCPRYFNNKSNLIVHLRIHTGEKPFQCWLCEKRFRQQSNLIQHLKNHEDVLGDDLIPRPRKLLIKEHANGKNGQGLNLLQSTSMAQPRFGFLPFDGNPVHQNGQLYEAPQTIHIGDLTSSSECIPSDVDTDNSLQSPERTYKCSSCFKTFNHKSNLLVHERIHSGDKTYRCQECGKHFSQRTSLMVHLRTHTGEMPYSCLQCRRRFRQQSNLLYHIKTNTVQGQLNCTPENMPSSPLIPRLEPVVDVTMSPDMETSGPPPPWGHLESSPKSDTTPTLDGSKEEYHCSACDKVFTHQSNLLVHQRIHSGERTYHCHECNRQFSQRTSLMIHLRTHTGEMPYSCQCCGKRFRQQSNLLYHLKSHVGQGMTMDANQTAEYAVPRARGRPRKCDSNNDAREKRVVPQGKRTYKCTECPRRYNLMSNLVAHQKSHDLQPMYSCLECGDSFLHQGYLAVHKKQHAKMAAPLHGMQFCWRPNHELMDPQSPNAEVERSAVYSPQEK